MNKVTSHIIKIKNNLSDLKQDYEHRSSDYNLVTKSYSLSIKEKIHLVSKISAGFVAGSCIFRGSIAPLDLLTTKVTVIALLTLSFFVFFRKYPHLILEPCLQLLTGYRRKLDAQTIIENTKQQISSLIDDTIKKSPEALKATPDQAYNIIVNALFNMIQIRMRKNQNSSKNSRENQKKIEFHKKTQEIFTEVFLSALEESLQRHFKDNVDLKKGILETANKSNHKNELWNFLEKRNPDLFLPPLDLAALLQESEGKEKPNQNPD